MKERVLAFPDDVDVGTVVAYRGNQIQALQGPARGSVRVPAGLEVWLFPFCPVRGLSLLAPDDIHGIRTPKHDVTDEDLGRLSHLTGLRQLCCSKSPLLTDAGLASLAPQRLKDLDLYRAAVTDAGLVHLAGMIELERLHLGCTRVKGPGLALLAGLPRLRWLSLEETDVDDSAVPHLLRFRSLRRLAIGGTRLSAPGVRALRAAIPEEVAARDPGRRLARERSRAAVLRILVRRLMPDLPPDSPVEEALRRLLPPGSVVAEARDAGDEPVKLDLPLADLDEVALILARWSLGGDLRIVTPAGLDVWIPWLRRRGRDRRRVRSAGSAALASMPSPSRLVH